MPEIRWEDKNGKPRWFAIRPLEIAFVVSGFTGWKACTVIEHIFFPPPCVTDTCQCDAAKKLPNHHLDWWPERR
jgi:hypothetical protein